MNNRNILYGLLAWSVTASTLSILILMDFMWEMYYPNNDALDYITTEKVSLLDWGVSQLEESLEYARTPLLKKHKVFVYFENDTIVVSANTKWDTAKDVNTGVSWCEGLLMEIRKFFLVDPSSGEPNPGPQSSISVYFQHKFYPAPADVKQFGISFDKLVKIEAHVQVDNEEKPVECEAPLIGQSIKFIRPEKG